MSPPPMLEKRNSRRLSSNTIRTVNTSTSSSSSMEERKKSLSLVYPVEAPPFKISDIRNAIPSHCFKKSYFYSLLYASRDAAGILFLGYLATFINTLSFPPLVKALLWCVYWYTCGCVATGWWMIGHECGHGAFSDSKVLNYIVGFIAHTSLFVPFSAWAVTHARHHKNTNSLDDDEPFVPADRKSYVARRALGSLLESGAFSAISLTLMLVGGWPAYLLVDLGGPSKHSKKKGPRDHFQPWSVLFNSFEERIFVTIGTLGIFAWIYFLYQVCNTYGIQSLVAYYVIPLLIVNAHLVAITFLQHTHLGVPHFSSQQFSWLRGALCTIDRTWGPIRDHLFHHISDTHVVHHLFFDMPFYNAQEATIAVKKVLGEYYLEDHSNIEWSLWKTFNECKFSEKDPDGEDGIEWMRGVPEAKKGLKGL